MAVDVTPGDEFQAGRPTPLIAPWPDGSSPVRGYDVFPNGSFVTRVADDDGRTLAERFGATELHIATNWFTDRSPGFASSWNRSAVGWAVGSRLSV
jgi:hypothetical protein